MDREKIAMWAVASYPEKGDAAFLVHGTQPTSGFASEFYSGLRGYFVSRPFIHDIQRAIADLRDEVAVSIASQELARKLWQEHAEVFLVEMFAAHSDGQELFGEHPEAVAAWAKRHVESD